MKNNGKVKLYNRQKLLLALLQAFGGSLANTDLQKYLFLYTKLCQMEKSYEFVPYKFGCFSFQSYADRRKLIELEILNQVEHWEIGDNNVDYLSLLSKSEQKKLLLFKDKYKNLSGDKLVQSVYKNFPYFAINSEIAQSLMSKEELEKINSARPSETEPMFFTIGYEGGTFENYLNRLITNDVKLLCDVRKNPLSRKYGFSKSTLSDTLEKLDIQYIHIPELGITSEKRQKLTTQADYDRLFDEYEHQTLSQNADALKKLFDLFIEKRRVAITCFEAEHRMCHRGRVAKALTQLPDWEYDIKHI